MRLVELFGILIRPIRRVIRAAVGPPRAVGLHQELRYDEQRDALGPGRRVGELERGERFGDVVVPAGDPHLRSDLVGAACLRDGGWHGSERRPARRQRVAGTSPQCRTNDPCASVGRRCPCFAGGMSSKQIGVGMGQERVADRAILAAVNQVAAAVPTATGDCRPPCSASAPSANMSTSAKRRNTSPSPGPDAPRCRRRSASARRSCESRWRSARWSVARGDRRRSPASAPRGARAPTKPPRRATRAQEVARGEEVRAHGNPRGCEVDTMIRLRNIA